MSASAALFTRSWEVGSRTVTMTLPQHQPGQMVQAAIEWAPGPPNQLSALEWQQYRSGRDAAVRELRDKLGVRIAVVDV